MIERVGGDQVGGDERMTRNMNNSDPGPGSDPRPSDEVMLAWIEGDLPASEVAHLEAQYPKAAFDVRLMRGDSAALRACAGEAAPLDLASRTIEALQRDSMLRLVADEARSPSEPVRMTTTREPVLARIGGWRVALAASLALALGAGVYFASTQGGRGLIPSDRVASSGPASNATDASVAPAVPDHVIADNRAAGDPSVEAAQPSATIALNTDSSASSLESAKIESASVVESSLAATDRLLALAREGRLVMRVEGASRPLSVVEATAARDKTRTWRLTKDVPESVLASLVPVVESNGSRKEADPSPVIVAADHMPEPSFPLGPSAAMRAPLREIAPHAQARATAYYAELSADADTLDLVRTLFAASLQGDVEFDVLDAPLAIESPAGIDDVLWWTQSPANWSPRVTVPVVVTRR